MSNTCPQCSSQFTIAQEDLDFYEKVSPEINCKKFLIPAPLQCPDCRERNRIAFRNERKLYQRKCDLCKKEIIAVHASEKKTKVYCTTCWWSDNWNSEDSGQDFDFSRPFFAQLQEVLLKAPLLNLFAKNNVNSDYVNQETDDKNCYLNAGGHFNEDCYYNTYCIKGKNNVDNYWLMSSELCYMCLHSESCYQSSYLQFCQNVRDSQYCFDCKDCDHCFGCYGLRHKKYYFFNEQLTKEAYEEKVAQATRDYEARELTKQKAAEYFLKYPHKATQNTQCEDVTGDQLTQCKNAYNCFNSEKLQDCKNVFIAVELKDVQDIGSIGWGELVYFSASSMQCYQVCFCSHSSEIKQALYCFQCFNIQHCFGCVGLHNKAYCILNKQYSKEQYEELLAKVIAHMQNTGEWGQFFPMALSPFAYNETVAQEYFPRTQEEIIDEGLNWHDPHSLNRYEGPKVAIPNRIEETQDELVKQILTCEGCGKNYKLIQQELEFYRHMHLPVPHHCWECRHRERINRNPPRKLWNRECSSCQIKLQTTYAPERKEQIVCEPCYLKETY
ncbi:MAG: hypothetical protein HY817_04255 [Candidatus Abawacabacteria bacterium]|nr:hypothetical protein [Candidatus Abawacabacteria bacterium]